MMQLQNNQVFADAHLVVKRLHPTIGAEISGVDLTRPISDSVRDEIKSLVHRHKVICFRHQHLTPEQHVAFAARFGSFYMPASVPKHETFEPIQKIAIDLDVTDTRQVPCATTVLAPFHADTSWRLVPTWGAILRAVQLPEVGGDTIWVDGAAAYAGLPEALKVRLADLCVTHDGRRVMRSLQLEYPIVAHPIVHRHAVTNESILWVGFNQHPHIVGLDIAESRELLLAILAQYSRPEYQFRFSWTPGAVVFWDNRSTVHCGVQDYGNAPRMLHRILLDDPEASVEPRVRRAAKQA